MAARLLQFEMYRRAKAALEAGRRRILTGGPQPAPASMRGPQQPTIARIFPFLGSQPAKSPTPAARPSSLAQAQARPPAGRVLSLDAARGPGVSPRAPLLTPRAPREPLPNFYRRASNATLVAERRSLAEAEAGLRRTSPLSPGYRELRHDFERARATLAAEWNRRLAARKNVA